jgi:hypothetical protein
MLCPQLQESFETVMRFLEESGNAPHRDSVLEQYTRGVAWGGIPAPPQTVTDPVVYGIVFSRMGNETAALLESRKWINAVEGAVGHLLERYIFSCASPHGWAWCAGSTVRATDFVKKTPSGWIQLQVKNRDNTENSSSTAIRNGTPIRKWFRFYSRSGKTNWDTLPVVMGENCGASENGFRKCIEGEISGISIAKIPSLDTLMEQ